MSSFDVTRERLPAERLDLIFRQSPAAHSEPPDKAVFIHAVLLFKANKKHSSEFSEKCFADFYLLVTSLPVHSHGCMPGFLLHCTSYGQPCRVKIWLFKICQ